MKLCMGVTSEVLITVTVNCLLACDVMLCGRLVRRFGGTCSCTLKIEAADSSEMSVPIHRITQCHIPETYRKMTINVESYNFDLHRSAPGLFNVQSNKEWIFVHSGRNANKGNLTYLELTTKRNMFIMRCL